MHLIQKIILLSLNVCAGNARRCRLEIQTQPHSRGKNLAGYAFYAPEEKCYEPVWQERIGLWPLGN